MSDHLLVPDVGGVTLFADPYLRCERCAEEALGFVISEGEHRGANWPCLHKAAIHSICPSWSPVEGCCCVAHLGRRTHPLAPKDQLRGRP